MMLGEKIPEEEINDYHYILRREALFPWQIQAIRMPTTTLDKYAVATILRSGFKAKSMGDADWTMYMLNKSGCGLYNAKREWVGVSSIEDIEKFISRWRPSPMEATEGRLRAIYPDHVYDQNKAVEETVVMDPKNLVLVPIQAVPVWKDVKEESPVAFEYPVTIDAYKQLDEDRASMVLDDARYKSGWESEDMGLMMPREIAMREVEHVMPRGVWAHVPAAPLVWVNQWRGVRYVITQDLRVFALAHVAKDYLVEAAVGDVMLITDVLWVNGATVSRAPLAERMRRAEGLDCVSYGTLGEGAVTDRWLQKNIGPYWSRG